MATVNRKPEVVNGERLLTLLDLLDWTPGMLARRVAQYQASVPDSQRVGLSAETVRLWTTSLRGARRSSRPRKMALVEQVLGDAMRANACHGRFTRSDLDRGPDLTIDARTVAECQGRPQKRSR